MPPKKFLSATNALIAINVLVYLVEYFGPLSLRTAIDDMALSSGVVFTGAWYTLVTSMFMHGGFEHLICNMITLYWVGTILEEAYGALKYAVLYFVSGLAGGIAFVFINLYLGQLSYAVGASGAIFGLFGAYIYLLWRESRRNVIYVRPVAKSDVTSMLALLAVNVLFGLAPGIAWEAHFGGFVAGVVCGIVIYAMETHKISKSHASALDR